MFLMIHPILAVNQDIVNEYNDESIQIWSHDPMHQVHENCWSVSHAKRHNRELE
ncbi:hypothetical protein Syun_022568 [Stephania yunnanensis]|uniref:Uncharacterized protein n=1 Tax=Stephania yunnanensis TaxID=152371 RepID=A0AAP0I1L8_9MAGN